MGNTRNHLFHRFLCHGEAVAEMKATTGFSTIHSLLNFANEGLLDAGESGEIVGRLLTIDAYDFALRKRPPRGPRHMYHSWVPVLEFLEAFFTDRVYEDIIKIKPYRRSDSREAFKNAVIRLTHYVRLSQLNLITTANVRKAFIRGMGLVGAASQKLIDIVIPLLFVDLEKGPSDWIVDQTRMSHLMTNWKNKATDAPHSDAYDDYNDLNMELTTILMWNQFGSKQSKYILPNSNISSLLLVMKFFEMHPTYSRSTSLLWSVHYQDGLRHHLSRLLGDCFCRISGSCHMAGNGI